MHGLTPDNVADKLAGTDVKIVVARDGTIISAEIVNKSRERRSTDPSNELCGRWTIAALSRPMARDEQRIFLIRFNLNAKEASG